MPPIFQCASVRWLRGAVSGLACVVASFTCRADEREGPYGEPGSDGSASPEPALVEHRSSFTRVYWDGVLARRKTPGRSAEFVVNLKDVFRAAGVPPEWVWIAEVESSWNPLAMSQVGARGLFQLMPDTAQRFGLELIEVDERDDPGRAAHAAAAYLRFLHRRFQSWSLALAAYNAGEGRVGRALAEEKATTLDGILHRLPAETRVYVPKVMATVAARESVDPEALPAPVVPVSGEAEATGKP